MEETAAEEGTTEAAAEVETRPVGWGPGTGPGPTWSPPEEEEELAAAAAAAAAGGGGATTVEEEETGAVGAALAMETGFGAAAAAAADTGFGGSSPGAAGLVVAMAGR